MAQIVLDCPWCRAQSMTMIVHARVLTRDFYGIAYAQCSRCTKPVAVILNLKVQGFKFGNTYGAWTTQGNDVVNDTGAQISDVVPKIPKDEAPNHVPQDTARVFVQAKSAEARGDRDTAGMGFRKAIDIGLKAFDQSVSGTLVQRIDKLADTHRITQAMKDWAHQVRLIGNETAHEEFEPSDVDIKAISDFTETLLEYLFTLPEEVKRRRAATAPASSTA